MDENKNEYPDSDNEKNGDGVNREPENEVNIDTAPVYHGYGTYNYGGNGYYNGPNPAKPPKKNNKLLITLLIVSLSLCLVFSTALAGALSLILPNLLDDGFNGGSEFPDNIGQLLDSSFDMPQAQTPGTPYSSLADAYESTHKTFVSITVSSETEPSIGAGSGVIIGRLKDNSGYYIVTNNHVVENATKIIVELYDGTTYVASKTVLRDEITDLAVVVISETRTLAVAKIGKSENIRVGESIYVIGNPLGTLAGTLTNGIISSKAQEIYINNHHMDVIQTNAAINPGNSGGPMFNMAGELIGIVNAKMTGVEVEGIGFAIPVDTVVDIVEQMIKQGYVNGRHNLGISTQHDRYGTGGLWLSSLDKNSDLFKAGIPYNTLYAYQIHSINGYVFQDDVLANEYIDTLKVGDTVTISLTVYEIGYSTLVPVQQKTYSFKLTQKLATD